MAPLSPGCDRSITPASLRASRMRKYSDSGEVSSRRSVPVGAASEMGASRNSRSRTAGDGMDGAGLGAWPVVTWERPKDAIQLPSLPGSIETAARGVKEKEQGRGRSRRAFARDPAVDIVIGTVPWRYGRTRMKDEKVHGYVLNRLLGTGTFGEVWEARAPGGFRAAVKIIRK